ncbi:MAG TPA: hypothetical protein VKA46_02370 [Gemmataceae bacterium]|nr:hypothetical protein [Gemmataceae bacterium]
MSRLLRKLWSDDCGALLASEFLFLFSMLVVGTVTGMTAMRQALVSEMVESGNALLALNQSYSFSGVSVAGVASTAGSSAVDQTNNIPMAQVAASPAAISQTPCE